jgi:hypothetical protein
MTTEEDDLTLIYSRPRRPRSIWLPVLCGLGAFLVAAAIFALRIFIPPERGMPFPVFIGGTVIFTLLGLGAIAAAFRKSGGVYRVELETDGLNVSDESGVRKIAWPEIGWVQRLEPMLPVPNASGSLGVFSPQGKKLAEFDSGLSGYEDLVTRLQGRVNASMTPEAESHRKRGTRWMAALAFCMGLAFVIGAPLLGWHEWTESQKLQRLVDHGQMGLAKIVRLYVFNVTPRLQYEVSAGGKTYRRDVMLTQDDWDRLQGQSDVPVTYLPEEPAFSRMVGFREMADEEHGGTEGKLLLAALGTLIGVFFLIAGVFQWHGWDLASDPNTGKLSLRRWGEDVRTWGGRS